VDVINDVLVDESSPNNEENPSTSFEIGSALTSLPCSLAMGHETSPYTISEVIREARRMNRNSKQGLAFLLAVHFSLSFLMVLDYILLLPPIFDSYQIIWVLWVIVPIMTVSYLWTPHEPDVMKQLPVKNLNHLEDFSRFLKYYFLRLTPAILMCQAVFIV
jgi:magnesium-transporting ATPase (P-type)